MWHFVVGDTPWFLPAVVIVAGYALIARRVHPALWFGLPALVLAVLLASVWRERGVRKQRGREPL